MYIKEENGYFNDGHETPAFLIWKGEVGGELVAGPMKETEADKMIAELQPVKTKLKEKKEEIKKRLKGDRADRARKERDIARTKKHLEKKKKQEMEMMEEIAKELEQEMINECEEELKDYKPEISDVSSSEDEVEDQQPIQTITEEINKEEKQEIVKEKEPERKIERLQEVKKIFNPIPEPEPVIIPIYKTMRDRFGNLKQIRVN